MSEREKGLKGAGMSANESGAAAVDQLGTGTGEGTGAESYRADLELARRLIEAADGISRSRFGALDLKVDTKPDHTPVTDADKAVEAAIRVILATERPGDAVYGEELGKQDSTGRRWIIDPIDGTKNFVRGVPVWGTLIGLEVDGQMVLGAVSAPMLKTHWWAAQGLGAWKSFDDAPAQRLQVSQVADLADASISFSSFTGWQAAGIRPQVMELTDKVWRVRGFGDFWQYMLVAEGAIDIAAEPELDLYDMGALVCIVTEAGGSFTDLQGRPGPWGGNAVASNGLLHEAALEYLGLPVAGDGQPVDGSAAAGSGGQGADGGEWLFGLS